MDGAYKKTIVLMVSLVMLIYAAHSETGTATYYTQSGLPTACFVSSPGPYAAAGPAIWGSRGACGRRYRISCSGGTPNPCTGVSVDVEIVDYCPVCKATFDLSQNAFAAIANLNAGTISIEYQQL